MTYFGTCGAVPKGIKPKRNKRKTRKCPEHLEWVASLPCCVTGLRPVAVHHLIHYKIQDKVGRRDDKYVIPIHRDYHDLARGVHGPEGEIGFLESRGVDGVATARALAKISPHRGKLK